MSPGFKCLLKMKEFKQLKNDVQGKICKENRIYILEV